MTGAPAQPEPSLWRRLLRSAPLVLGLPLVASIMYWKQFGVIRDLEAFAGDIQIRWRAEYSGPRRPYNVSVVRINDSDYDSLFRATSPLHVLELQAVIEAIALGRPRVIGVDIDTSDSTFKELRLSPRASAIPIVWARNVVELCGCRAETGCGLRLPISPDSLRRKYRYCCEGERGAPVPLDYLGGRNTGDFGLATLPNDPDGFIRRYSRFDPSSREATFAWRVARAADSTLPEDSTLATREARISFQPFSADAQLTALDVRTTARQNPGFDQVEGTVVLLGGDYWAARDIYPTPLGKLAGVDIHGQIVETELQRKRVTSSGVLLLVLLEVSSIALLFIFHFWPTDMAVRRAVLAIVLLAPAFSWAATRSAFSLVPIFALVLAVIVGYQMWEYIKDISNERLRRVIHTRLRPYVLGGAPIEVQAGKVEHSAKALGPGLERRMREATTRYLSRGAAATRRLGQRAALVLRKRAAPPEAEGTGTPHGPTADAAARTDGGPRVP